MGKVKEYMMDLSEGIGKDFEDITESDMEKDFRDRAQATWGNPESTTEELLACKQYLDKKSFKDVSFYKDDSGHPRFKVGTVMEDPSTGLCYIITE